MGKRTPCCFAAIGGLCFLVLVLSSCQPAPSLVGHWQSVDAAAIRYDFREDGTVYVTHQEKQYPMFHYRIQPDGTLQLFDGMGRERDYRFWLSGDQATLTEIQHKTADLKLKRVP